MAYNRNKADIRRRAPRACERCGQPTTSSRHHYCDDCRAWAERKHQRHSASRRHLASTAERGYDGKHQKLRRRWAPKVRAGEVCCARCGQPILPDEPWDLGHDDLDRSQHVGPEHTRCNRATAGRRKAGRTRADWW